MPIIPGIPELTRRLTKLDATAIHSVVIDLSDIRSDTALRYDKLGDSSSDRPANLIQYCHDHCCMGQLVSALNSYDPAILNDASQSADGAWDKWANQYDASHTKVDLPGPSPVNPISPPSGIGAGNIMDNSGNTAVGTGINQNNYSGVQGGVVNNYYFGGMNSSVSNTPSSPMVSNEQGDFTPFELQQAASVVSKLRVFGPAAELYSRALALANRGRFAEMIDYCLRALNASQSAGDLNAQLNILGDLARAYALLGRSAESLTTYQQAINLAMQIGNYQAAGTGWYEQGNIFALLGQTQQAWANMSQAYNLFMSVGDLNSAYVCSMRATTLQSSLPLW